jgi:hypothetical protein
MGFGGSSNRVTDANGDGYMAGPGRAILVLSGGSADRMPGAFPFTLEFETESGGTEQVPVPAPMALRPNRPFRSVRMLGGTANAGYSVILLGEGDSVAPTGEKSRRLVEIFAAGTAVPQAAPVGSVGFELTPTLYGLVLLLAGAAGNATFWRQTKGGTWLALADPAPAVGPSAAPTEINTIVGGGRFYIQASAPGMTMELNGQAETG